MVWGLNSGKSKIFHTCPCPTSGTVGAGPFPGIKWPGRGINHSSPTIAKARERVELYLYLPLCPHERL